MRTAWLVGEGGRIWRGDRPTVIVPPNHVGVVCGSCEFVTLRPRREAEAELLRVTHGLTVHGEELQARTYTLHLAEFVDADGLRFPRLDERGAA